MLRGCFVTGTDTGVGKTLAACALVRGLRSQDIDVGVMKPIETGVGDDGPLDALHLKRAAKSEDSLELICPQQFALPAAPTVAARAEGRSIDIGVLDDAYDAIASRHRTVVVEGAGGLLVPAAEGLTMADLAARWQLPLVLVARTRLGTINHTRLTLEAIRSRNLPLLGVILSHADGALSDADRANLAALREDGRVPILAEIPPDPPDSYAIGLESLREPQDDARR